MTSEFLERPPAWAADVETTSPRTHGRNARFH
jgi:hypothetical protein